MFVFHRTKILHFFPDDPLLLRFQEEVREILLEKLSTLLRIDRRDSFTRIIVMINVSDEKLSEAFVLVGLLDLQFFGTD